MAESGKRKRDANADEENACKIPKPDDENALKVLALTAAGQETIPSSQEEIITAAEENSRKASVAATPQSSQQEYATDAENVVQADAAIPVDQHATFLEIVNGLGEFRYISRDTILSAIRDNVMCIPAVYWSTLGVSIVAYLHGLADTNAELIGQRIGTIFQTIRITFDRNLDNSVIWQSILNGSDETHRTHLQRLHDVIERRESSAPTTGGRKKTRRNKKSNRKSRKNKRKSNKRRR